ncbi:quinol oxidase subunit 4 [Desertivirga arenae]|uniref:quinol oxidase subunit 4 n=1 Tax=Desertivirga arenae TaxID=2810309 RepID=UPI001F600DDE|nr:quinol oxidase subunit 4 [Pedobacter sp. SYSU D00823]
MLRKTLQFAALITLSLFLFAGCTTYTAGRSGNVPPGKAKKITGSKSAKPYAPGQRKKK